MMDACGGPPTRHFPTPKKARARGTRPENRSENCRPRPSRRRKHCPTRGRMDGFSGGLTACQPNENDDVDRRIRDALKASRGLQRRSHRRRRQRRLRRRGDFTLLHTPTREANGTKTEIRIARRRAAGAGGPAKQPDPPAELGQHRARPLAELGDAVAQELRTARDSTLIVGDLRKLTADG